MPSPVNFNNLAINLQDVGVFFRRHRRMTNLKDFVLKHYWLTPPSLIWALRHVDIQCKEGEVLGIVGPNGSGKSTLCLVLAGILTPDEGTAAINGRISALLSISAGFHPDLSGRTNIISNGILMGIPRKEIVAKIDEIVTFAELEDFIDEPVRTYSTGMRSRLGFAVATSIDPDILILDEVLSAGDASFQVKSSRRLKELMARSRLMIVVSHDLPFLRTIAHSCLWLEKGEVRLRGETNQVLDAYAKEMLSRTDNQ